MFGWYFIWKSLANDDITKMDAVGKLPLSEWLNFMLLSERSQTREKLNDSNLVQFS